MQENENIEIQEQNKPDEIESQVTNEIENEPVEAQDEIPEEENAEQETDEGSQGQNDKEYKRHLFNNLRRENYRYATKIAELENQILAEREEMDRLRYLNDLSTQTALGHYEQSAKNRLDKARQQREIALESGDVKAIAETDIELSKAVFEYEKLRGYKAEQDFQAEQAQAQMRMPPSQMPQNNYPQLSQENYVSAGEWFDNNDWFNTTSPDFNPQKYAFANQLIENLDAYCVQNNMPNLIGSREYFNTLNKQIEQYYKPNNAPQRQGNSMQRSVVAPTRSRGVPTMSNGAPQRMRGEAPLTNEQRDMIKKLGVSEQEFRKSLNWHKKNDYYGDQLMQQKGRR